MDESILTQLQESEPLRKTVPILTAAGEQLRTDVVSNIYTEGEKRVVQFNVREITARKRMEAQRVMQEEQTRQSQKMEAMGRLAEDVASDFYDLLSTLLTHCDALDKRLESSDIDRSSLEQIRAVGERASVLTRQLLAFGKTQEAKLLILDLNEAISDMRRLIEAMLPGEVQLELKLGDQAAMVRADRGQIEQVILNLVLNARDAMPQGGRIAVRTGSLSVSEPGPERTALVLPPGDYVSLIVQDVGLGIDGDTQPDVLEPFFATKPKGAGGGIGLATSYYIVRQFGGYISVASTLGAGTTFSVYLPRCRGRATAAAAE